MVLVQEENLCQGLPEQLTFVPQVTKDVMALVCQNFQEADREELCQSLCSQKQLWCSPGQRVIRANRQSSSSKDIRPFATFPEPKLHTLIPPIMALIRGPEHKLVIFMHRCSSA